MGELQHGTYDDECDGLTLEEVNAFYGFGEDGEPPADEDSNQLNDSEEQEGSDGESEADMELDEIEPRSVDVIDLEEMKVCFFYELENNH